MKVLINIPTKSYGVDIADKFQDFFKKLQVETKEHLIANDSLLCGALELDTIEMFLKAFKEMQIIPNNATNGDIIKAMFPNTYSEECDYDVFTTLDGDTRFTYDWWDAQYDVGK